MIYLFVGFLHLFWLVALGLTITYWRGGKALAARQPVAIAEAVPGQPVLLQGRVAREGAPTHASTLGQISCVWHSWRVEREYERRKSADSSDTETYFEIEEDGASRDYFAVEDAARNRILVVPDKAGFESTKNRVWIGSTPRPMPEGTPDQPGSDTYRYSERWLLPAQTLVVLGHLDPPGPNDPPGMRGRVARGGKGPFIIAGSSPKLVAASMLKQARMGAWVTGVALAIALLVTWLALG